MLDINRLQSQVIESDILMLCFRNKICSKCECLSGCEEETMEHTPYYDQHWCVCGRTWHRTFCSAVHVSCSFISQTDKRVKPEKRAVAQGTFKNLKNIVLGSLFLLKPVLLKVHPPVPSDNIL